MKTTMSSIATIFLACCLSKELVLAEERPDSLFFPPKSKIYGEDGRVTMPYTVAFATVGSCTIIALALLVNYLTTRYIDPRVERLVESWDEANREKSSPQSTV